jgi:predicted lipoprotein with Yx(FWY)xxD motif
MNATGQRRGTRGGAGAGAASTLRARVGLAAVALAGAAVLAGCGSTHTATSSSSSPTAGSSSTTAGSSTGGSSTTMASAGSVSVVSTAAGKVLAAPDGRTVYELSTDTVGHDTCDAACQKVWPPVIVTTLPSRGSGVMASLSTVHTAAGDQLVIGGHPVFTFVGDTGSGQSSGQGIHSFGGVWYALDSSGAPVMAMASTSTTTSGGYGSGY